VAAVFKNMDWHGFESGDLAFFRAVPKRNEWILENQFASVQSPATTGMQPGSHLWSHDAIRGLASDLIDPAALAGRTHPVCPGRIDPADRIVDLGRLLGVPPGPIFGQIGRSVDLGSADRPYSAGSSHLPLSFPLMSTRTPAKNEAKPVWFKASLSGN